jgi:uncharacterized membrane protein YphA (DoxX/SURF4 family)
MMQSSPFNFRRVVILIGRILLAGLFIYAGYAKIRMPTLRQRPSLGVALTFFAMQVDSYQLLPKPAVNVVAYTLPFAEIALGLLLLIGWQLRIWTSLLTLVMAGFFFGVLRAYLLHMEINCGCFGVPEKVTLLKVFEDGALLALMALLTVFVFLEARKPHPWTATESA